MNINLIVNIVLGVFIRGAIIIPEAYFPDYNGFGCFHVIFCFISATNDLS